VLENRELGQLDFAGPLLGNRRCVRASINEKPQISIRNQDDDQGLGSYRVSVAALPRLPSSCEGPLSIRVPAAMEL